MKLLEDPDFLKDKPENPYRKKSVDIQFETVHIMNRFKLDVVVEVSVIHM